MKKPPVRETISALLLAFAFVASSFFLWRGGPTGTVVALVVPALVLVGIAAIGHSFISALGAMIIGVGAPLAWVPAETETINIYPILLPFVFLGCSVSGFLVGLVIEGKREARE